MLVFSFFLREKEAPPSDIRTKRSTDPPLKTQREERDAARGTERKDAFLPILDLPPLDKRLVGRAKEPLMRHVEVAMTYTVFTTLRRWCGIDPSPCFSLSPSVSLTLPNTDTHPKGWLKKKRGAKSNPLFTVPPSARLPTLNTLKEQKKNTNEFEVDLHHPT